MAVSGSSGVPLGRGHGEGAGLAVYPLPSTMPFRVLGWQASSVHPQPASSVFPLPVSLTEVRVGVGTLAVEVPWLEV